MDKDEEQTPIEGQGTPESRGDPSASAPQASMSSPINWDDDEVQPSSDEVRESSTVNSVVPPADQPASAGSRSGFYMTYLSSIAAVVLVVALLGVGFVVGHYVDKPLTPAVPAYTKTGLPSSGSSGYGSPGYNFSFPNYTGPQSTPSTTDKAAAKVAKEVDPGLV
ncbi:MAG: hypothetical protein WA359_09235, partial [Acidimicrobiales bacterium]